MHKNLLIALLLVFTTSCAKTTFVRSAPDFESTLSKARIALLLPPIIEVNQVDALNKKTRMYNYEDYLEGIIIDAFIAKMHDKGYNVKPFTRTEIANNKLSSHFVDTKDNFDELLNLLYSKGAWKEEAAYSINHIILPAASLSKDIGADLLILMKFYGESKTSGAITKDFTMNVLTAVLTGRSNSSSDLSEFSMVRLAILDSTTGRVLWAHSVSTSNDMLGTALNKFSSNEKVDRENLTTLFSTALVDLPSAK